MGIANFSDHHPSSRCKEASTARENWEALMDVVSDRNTFVVLLDPASVAIVPVTCWLQEEKLIRPRFERPTGVVWDQPKGDQAGAAAGERGS
jgi:hypothetical protein